jgi:hypothetical protein
MRHPVQIHIFPEDQNICTATDFQETLQSYAQTLWQFQRLFRCIHLCLLDTVTGCLCQAFSAEVYSNGVHPRVCWSLTLNNSAEKIQWHKLQGSSLVWQKNIQMRCDGLAVTSRVTGSYNHCPGVQNSLNTNHGLEHVNLQLVPSNSVASALLSLFHLQYSFLHAFLLHV